VLKILDLGLVRMVFSFLSGLVLLLLLLLLLLLAAVTSLPCPSSVTAFSLVLSISSPAAAEPNCISKPLFIACLHTEHLGPMMKSGLIDTFSLIGTSRRTATQPLTDI
jgi:hypothetical protein